MLIETLPPDHRRHKIHIKFRSWRVRLVLWLVRYVVRLANWTLSHGAQFESSADKHPWWRDGHFHVSHSVHFE